MADNAQAATSHPSTSLSGMAARFNTVTHTLRRLLALWGIAARLDLMWVARDLPTALALTASDMVLVLAQVTATFLLAARFNGIGAWSVPRIVFMLGYALLMTRIPDILFNFNVSFISRRIGRGQLDHTLIQPQPLWMALLTDGFTPFDGALANLPGIALLIWAGTQLHLAVTPGWVGLFALNLLASIVIGLAFTYVIGSLAFWAPRAAEEINSSSWKLLSQLKQFPLDGLSPALLAGLVTAVPVGLLAWYPSRALLGLDPAPYAVYVTPLAAVAFAAVAVVVFRKGLAEYARTGSQRYLALGHRR